MGGNGRHELRISTPTEREIVMSRVFDAPRELVFEAHSSCEHMSRWWVGPDHEVVDCEIDFRPGGAWRMAHRAPDGREIRFFGEYREIVPPERIVWTFGFEGMPGEPAPETYVFDERDGRTTITSTAVLGSKEERDALLESGMVEGATRTYERLDEYLEVLRAARAAS